MEPSNIENHRFYWNESYKKRNVQEWVEEARKNDGKLDITDDDLVFNTAELIEAKRMLEILGTHISTPPYSLYV